MADLHVAIVEPDSRGRLSLGKWMTRQPGTRWLVYVSKDGRTLRLEALAPEEE